MSSTEPVDPPESSSTPAPSRQETRARLISSAESLFAAHSVESVSLNQIRVASGVLNRSAVQYHFGDRDGLVSAIVEKHAPRYQARLQRRLAELSGEDTAPSDKPAIELRARIEATVDFIDDSDGGCDYIAILAELTTSPKLSQIIVDQLPGAAGELDATDVTPQEQSRLAVMLLSGSMILHSLVGYIRFREAGRTAAFERDDLVKLLMRFLARDLDSENDRRA